MIRAAVYDREMLSALGADVGKLYTLMFMAGSFLAGLGGALVTPVRSIVPGMDVEIIVEAFIVVVIGGLGSFWARFSARSYSARCLRSEFYLSRASRSSRCSC